MDKDIKDFLHLYLGCDIKTPQGFIVKLTVINLEKAIRNNWLLILRLLSDMSEEEKVFHSSLQARWKASPVHVLVCVGETPESFLYLLSKYFDLFNLIPEGLAIDATTLKK